MPKDHTGIGYLAQIISAIEAEPYSPDLTPVNRKLMDPIIQDLIADKNKSLFHGPPMRCRVWLINGFLAARKTQESSQE